MSQQSARFSIDEVQSGAALADDRLITVAWLTRVVIVQPVLDFRAGYWTGEGQTAHQPIWLPIKNARLDLTQNGKIASLRD
jgi:hypothetical protein